MSYRTPLFVTFFLLSTCFLAQKATLAIAPTLEHPQTITPRETARYPLLKPGATGEEVKKIQSALQQKGYFDGETDGIYGEKTKLAVSQFQKDHNLDIDGMVGEATWKLLEKPKATINQTAENQENQEKVFSGSHLWQTNRRNSNQDQILIWGIGAVFVTVTVGGGLFFVIKGSQQLNRTTETEELNPERQQKGSKKTAKRPLKVTQPEAIISNSALTVVQDETEQTSPISPVNSGKQNHQVEEQKLTVKPVQSESRLAKVDVVQDLIHDLQKSDPSQRRKAIWGLAQRGDSRAMEPLVQMMLEVDSQERSLILEAVSQISSRTLKPLNRALTIALQDSNSQVRKNAIRDMTRVYDLMSQMNQRLSLAVNDSDDEVKETAQWALGQLNELRKLPDLEQLSRKSA
jgi:peptidoglycan hydrolase-like protein with peptidoglycan-binding domain